MMTTKVTLKIDVPTPLYGQLRNAASRRRVNGVGQIINGPDGEPLSVETLASAILIGVLRGYRIDAVIGRSTGY